MVVRDRGEEVQLLAGQPPTPLVGRTKDIQALILSSTQTEWTPYILDEL